MQLKEWNGNRNKANAALKTNLKKNFHFEFLKKEIPNETISLLTLTQFEQLQAIMEVIIKYSCVYGRVFVITQNDHYSNQKILGVSIFQNPYNTRLIEFYKKFLHQNTFLYFINLELIVFTDYNKVLKLMKRNL